MNYQKFSLYWDWHHRMSELNAECAKVKRLLDTLEENKWPKDEHGNVLEDYHSRIASKIFSVENECEKLASMARWQSVFSVDEACQCRARRLVKDHILANFKVEIDDIDNEKRVLRIPCLMPKRNTKDSEYFWLSLETGLEKLSYDEFENGPFLIEFTSVYPEGYPYDVRLNTTPEIATVVEKMFFNDVVEYTGETNYSLMLSTRKEPCDKPYTEITITRKK